jgi:outer membrane protein W
MIRSTTTLLLSLGILSLSSAAFAQTATKPGGISLGLRTGYSLPMGRLNEGYLTSSETAASSGSDSDLSAHVNAMVPIQIDAGYRISPNVWAGVFFQYGVGLVNSDKLTFCKQDNCSIQDMSFGIQAHYHFLPENSLDPWLGAGLGYEMLVLDVSGLTRESSGYRGFLASLQAGADFRPTPNFGLGPFVSVAFGHYDVSTFSNGVVDDSSNMDGEIHEWITIGARGQFDL